MSSDEPKSWVTEYKREAKLARDRAIVFADADEARAWDRYVAGLLSVPTEPICDPMSGRSRTLSHDVGKVSVSADAMLRERRQRMLCGGDVEWWDNYSNDPNGGGEMVVSRCGLFRGHKGECKR